MSRVVNKLHREASYGLMCVIMALIRVCMCASMIHMHQEQLFLEPQTFYRRTLFCDNEKNIKINSER